MGMGGAIMTGEHSKIDARARARLAKLVAMLAAPSDGEVLNAARAITSTLKAANADINDLAALVNGAAALETMVQTSTRDRHLNMLRAMAATSIRGLHDAKTSQFLRHMVTLLDNGRLPSNAQTQWLMNIYFGRG